MNVVLKTFEHLWKQTSLIQIRLKELYIYPHVHTERYYILGQLNFVHENKNKFKLLRTNCEAQ
jgi:hypothetical protein